MFSVSENFGVLIQVVLGWGESMRVARDSGSKALGRGEVEKLKNVGQTGEAKRREREEERRERKKGRWKEEVGEDGSACLRERPD